MTLRPSRWNGYREVTVDHGDLSTIGVQDMKSITPFLWFDSQAEEAMEFYTSLFPDSKVLNVTRYGDAGPGRSGRR